jgi:hypothetical protein
MKALYVVATRDVDGIDTRKYKTYKGAAKRFQEMAGYPLRKGLTVYQSISDFGCVVTFWVIDGAPVPAYEAPVEVETNDDADYFYDCDTRQEYIGIPHSSDYI